MRYDMQVFCRETHSRILIIIESNEQARGEIAKGKPIICEHEKVCRKAHVGECFLNCEQIEGRI